MNTQHLKTLILGRLSEPRTAESVRKWAVESGHGLSAQVAEALDALSRERDIECYLDGGRPWLRRSGPVAIVPGADAKEEHWALTCQRGELTDQIAGKNREIDAETDRIAPQVKEARDRCKRAIERLEAEKLAGLRTELQGLEVAVDELDMKLEETLTAFRARQRAAAVAADPEGAAIAERIGRAKQQSLEVVP